MTNEVTLAAALHARMAALPPSVVYYGNDQYLVGGKIGTAEDALDAVLELARAAGERK